jgi:hypothetical protein
LILLGLSTVLQAEDISYTSVTSIIGLDCRLDQDLYDFIENWQREESSNGRLGTESGTVSQNLRKII